MQFTDALKTIVNEYMYPYQRTWILSDARFRWTNASRQVGKSEGLSFRRIARGIARRRNQLFLSAGERQSRELMRKAHEQCKMLEVAAELTESQELFGDIRYTKMEISLPSVPMRIIGLPANPATARGFTGDVFLDEFAIHRDSREIWVAMFPSVMRGRGEIDVSSTPLGKKNKFYELKRNEAFEHTTLTILDAIQQGLQGVDPDAERAGLDDEDRWRQEYMCEFVDAASAFLPYDMIVACEDDALPYELDLDALGTLTGAVFVGIDIGRRQDLTVAWVFERVGDQLVSLGMIELKSTPFREQFDILSKVIAHPCVHRTCIDETGLGMQLAEQLKERFGSWKVAPVTFTPQIKSTMAGLMRVKMEGRMMRIPAHRRIRDDLHSMEKLVTIDGNVRLRAPRTEGSHADRFWAAALAVTAASEDAGPIEATFGPPLRFARQGTW